MDQLQRGLKVQSKQLSRRRHGESVLSLSNQIVNDGNPFLDVIAFVSRGQRSEDLRCRKPNRSIHRPRKVAYLPLSIRGTTEVEEMDELAGAHAHDDVRGRRVGPEVSAVFRLDAFSDKSLLGLTSQVHHVFEVQFELMPLNLDRDPEVSRNSRRLQVTIATRAFHVPLTVSTPHS